MPDVSSIWQLSGPLTKTCNMGFCASLPCSLYLTYFQEIVGKKEHDKSEAIPSQVKKNHKLD